MIILENIMDKKNMCDDIAMGDSNIHFASGSIDIKSADIKIKLC
jgi:anaerobic glycerol-3-phosphate dehydrogenase